MMHIIGKCKPAGIGNRNCRGFPIGTLIFCRLTTIFTPSSSDTRLKRGSGLRPACYKPNWRGLPSAFSFFACLFSFRVCCAFFFEFGFCLFFSLLIRRLLDKIYPHSTASAGIVNMKYISMAPDQVFHRIMENLTALYKADC